MRGTLIRAGRMVYTPWREQPWEFAMAIVVLLGCLAIPLALNSGSADSFALAKTGVVRVLLVVVLGIIGVRLALGDPIPIPSTEAVDWAMIGFVVANAAAFAFSIDWRQSLYGESLQHQGVLALSLYVAFHYLARAVFNNPNRTRHLCVALVLGALLVSVYAILQRLDLDPLWDLPTSARVFSSIGQPNALAAYLVLSIPVAFALSFWGSARLRRFSIVAMVISMAALGLTLSRGGYLGLTVSGVILAFGLVGRDDRSRKRLRRAGLLGITLLAVVTFTLGNTVWSALGDTDLGRRSDHLSLWKVGLAITVDHPFVGTGQETYPLVFPEYRDDVLDPPTARYLSTFRPESPHNLYIATAAGAGIPTLVAFLTVVALAMRRMLSAAMRSTLSTKALLFGIAAAMSGHLVTDLFMTQEVTGSWVFWVLMGAGVGTAQGPLKTTELE